MRLIGSSKHKIHRGTLKETHDKIIIQMTEGPFAGLRTQFSTKAQRRMSRNKKRLLRMAIARFRERAQQKLIDKVKDRI